MGVCDVTPGGVLDLDHHRAIGAPSAISPAKVTTPAAMATPGVPSGAPMSSPAWKCSYQRPRYHSGGRSSKWVGPKNWVIGPLSDHTTAVA